MHICFTALALYFLWSHLAHLQSVHRYVVLGGALTLTATSAWRLGLIICRNIRPGRPWPQAKIAWHGATAHLKIWLPNPCEVQAGQYVQVWVPSISLFSTHPFMVTWWDEDGYGKASTIHLHIKARKGLTRGLVSAAKSEPSLQAWIDGPYGVGLRLDNYATVVLLCTGIGIAAQIPYMKALLRSCGEGTARTKEVVLQWELYDDDNADWVCDWMDDLLNQDTEHVSSTCSVTKLLY